MRRGLKLVVIGPRGEAALTRKRNDSMEVCAVIMEALAGIKANVVGVY